MSSEINKIEDDFWNSYKMVKTGLEKMGVKIDEPKGGTAIKVIADVNNIFDFNKIIKNAVENNIKNEENIANKEGDYLEIGENKQPIYLVIVNKISNVCFDAERIDDYNGMYEKSYLKENLSKSLWEIKNLKKDYPNEFSKAFSRACRISLDSAIGNFMRPLDEWGNISLDNGVRIIKLFKSFDEFEKEYTNKINKLKMR